MDNSKFAFIHGVDEIQPGETAQQAMERVFREKKKAYEIESRDGKQDLDYNNDIVPSV